MNKKALITGITGQDGSYLADLLLSKGYEVHGIIRRASVFNTGRIEHIYQDPHTKDRALFLHYGDMTDSSNLNRLLKKVQPDEIYNLAAQSHVLVSFDVPEYTAEVDALGTLRLLDAIRAIELNAKFYQASTSEMFGGTTEDARSEEDLFFPHSPYACAKLYAYWIARIYRDAYDLFACNGILFNHESPRRGKRFVTRKITRAVANIANGNNEILYLGNLDAKRDWGYAPEYVQCMWMMLQQDKPDDYILATGEMHTVREFVEEAFRNIGMTVSWMGKGPDEVGTCNGLPVVKIDKRYFRPSETKTLLGNPSKAEKILGWKAKIKFKELVKLMVEADINDFKG